MNYKYAPKRDRNHAQIVHTFEDLGFSVKDVSMVPGWVDLTISRFGHNHLIEIKRDDHKTPPAKMKKTVTLSGWWKSPIYVVRTQQDVIALSQQLDPGKE